MAVFSDSNFPSGDENMSDTSGSDGDSLADESSVTWRSETLPPNQGLKLRLRLANQPLHHDQDTGSDETSDSDSSTQTTSSGINEYIVNSDTSNSESPKFESGNGFDGNDDDDDEDDSRFTEAGHGSVDLEGSNCGDDPGTEDDFSRSNDGADVQDPYENHADDDDRDQSSRRSFGRRSTGGHERNDEDDSNLIEPTLNTPGEENSNDEDNLDTDNDYSCSNNGEFSCDPHKQNASNDDHNYCKQSVAWESTGGHEAENEGDSDRSDDENSNHENNLDNYHNHSNDGMEVNVDQDDLNQSNKQSIDKESTGDHETKESSGENKSLLIPSRLAMEDVHDQRTKLGTPSFCDLMLASEIERRGGDSHEMESNDNANADDSVDDKNNTFASDGTPSLSTDRTSPSLAIDAILRKALSHKPSPGNAGHNFDNFNPAGRGGGGGGGGGGGDGASVPLKRPLNAYMIWSMERRREMKRDFPNLPVTEISKRLGAEWRGMSEAQKSFFYEHARELKEQFLVDNPDYKFERRSKKAKRSNEAAGNSNEFPRVSYVLVPTSAAAVVPSQELPRVASPESAAVAGPSGGVPPTSSHPNGEGSHSQEALPEKPQGDVRGSSPEQAVDPMWRSWIESAHRLRQYSVIAVSTPRLVSADGSCENPTPGTSGYEAGRLLTPSGSQDGRADETEAGPSTSNQHGPAVQKDQGEDYPRPNPGYSGQYENTGPLLPISSFLHSFENYQNVFTSDAMPNPSVEGRSDQKETSPAMELGSLSGNLDQTDSSRMNYRDRVSSEELSEPGPSRDANYYNQSAGGGQYRPSSSLLPSGIAAVDQLGVSAATAGGNQDAGQGRVDSDYSDVFSRMAREGRDEVGRLSNVLDTAEIGQYRPVATTPQPSPASPSYRGPYLAATDSDAWNPRGAAAYGGQFSPATTGSFSDQTWNEVLQSLASQSRAHLVTPPIPNDPRPSWYSNQPGRPDLATQWAAQRGRYPGEDLQGDASRQSPVHGRQSLSPQALDPDSGSRGQCSQTPIYFPPGAHVKHPRYGSAFSYVSKQGADPSHSMSL